MTDTSETPQVTSDQPSSPNLDNCTCMERTFFAIGLETGKQIRMLLDAELKSHMQSIENLKSIITLVGTPMVDPESICTKNKNSSEIPATQTTVII